MLVKIGTVLVIGGLVVVASFVLWEFLWSLFFHPDVPLMFKIAVPAVGVGLILLLLAVVRDRWRAAKKEPFKGVDR